MARTCTASPALLACGVSSFSNVVLKSGLRNVADLKRILAERHIRLCLLIS